MARRFAVGFILLTMLLSLTACGGLRFSQLDPAAKDFKPRRIAVFPADPGPYDEARDVLNRDVPAVLIEKRWFDEVMGASELTRQAAANEELQKALAEYISKLRTLNFSDDALSRKIGELTRSDAFLLVAVDYWNYATENDKKMARVGLGMRLIDARTGKIMWRAGHQRHETYRFMKPALADVAKKLVGRIADDMPR